MILEVQLVGVGYTASPQSPLPPANRDNVTAILTATLERAGVTVTTLPIPRNGDGPMTQHKTNLVPIPTPEQFATTPAGYTAALVFAAASARWPPPVWRAPATTAQRSPPT